MAADDVLFDQPLGLTVTDASPGQTVHLVAASVDADGTQWFASADFVADRHGKVDPARDAPIRGSYTGAHEAGLL